MLVVQQKKVRDISRQSLHLVLIEFEEAAVDFIPYPSEFRNDKILASLHLGRVVKADVQSMLDVAGKCRTTFVGSTANRNHIIPGLMQEAFYALRRVGGNVDAGFLHHLYCQRVDSRCGMCACGAYRQGCVERLHETVCHLAAATVSCA